MLKDEVAVMNASAEAAARASTRRDRRNISPFSLLDRSISSQDVQILHVFYSTRISIQNLEPDRRDIHPGTMGTWTWRGAAYVALATLSVILPVLLIVRAGKQYDQVKG